MSKQKISIIGAGLGGLSTGIYALIPGYNFISQNSQKLFFERS
ncbi:MAG: hypothetical protein ACTSPO_15445 [Candidatus Heimdallarchaeaceae archaeon]